MRNHWTKIFTLTICFFSLFIYSSAIAKEKEDLTVEWIHSEECRQVTDLPRFVWLRDSTALIYDTGKPKEERTFERLNPRNGKLVPLVDQTKAMMSLKGLLGEKEAPKLLSWPLFFDRTGQRAVYLIKGDIYLLDLPRSQFSRITETEEEEKSVTFSPDGRILAFVRKNDLYIYEIENKTEKRLTIGGSETILNGLPSWGHGSVFKVRGTGYSWSYDSKAISYLQSDMSPLSIMHYIDFKPIVWRVIKQRYAKAGEDNPIVRVGIVEISDAKTRWVDLSDASFEYIAKVKWLPGSRRLSVQTLNRFRDELNLYFVDRSTGKASHTLRETDEGWVNIHDNLNFLKNGKYFIWTSERSGYAHIYRFTMKGKQVNQVTKGDWAVRAAGRRSPGPGRAVVGIDEEKGWIYFTSIKESSIEHNLYRIKFDGTRMERLTKKDGLNRITFSPDTRYYFNLYSNKKTPPSFSLYKNNGKLVQVLAEPRHQILAKFDMQYPEFFTIPTSDGFPMPAELLKPKDFDPNKKYPLLLHVYQGPSQPMVANAWKSSIYFDQILLSRGYLVARVDNRSATGISKKIENLLWTVHRQMESTGELLDLLDAVRWLKSKPYIDPERVGIWGWSGGGSITLLAMTRSKEFKAGIAGAARTDWRYYNTTWTEPVMKRPQDNPKGYEESNLNKTAKNLHGRLLIVHGTYDDNVHMQNIWHFIDELIKAGKMVDMMFYPMRKHGFRDRPARIHRDKTYLDYWSRNL